MSSDYLFIIQFSIFGILLLNNLYLADIIENHVYIYMYQVSD